MPPTAKEVEVQKSHMGARKGVDGNEVTCRQAVFLHFRLAGPVFNIKLYNYIYI